jgi:hypothetical protein
MLFQQLDTGHGHAPVHGFAHVIDGEQGDLHGGEGFNKINNLQHTAFDRFP